MLEFGAVTRPVVHVITALDLQRNAITQRLEQVSRLRAEGNHHFSCGDRALAAVDLPFAGDLA
ncbi:hypothetical protein D9M73_284300 [compost metagenome]